MNMIKISKRIKNLKKISPARINFWEVLTMIRVSKETLIANKKMLSPKYQKKGSKILKIKKCSQ